MVPLAKFLHCVRTACILRTQRLGYSPKNTCRQSRGWGFLEGGDKMLDNVPAEIKPIATLQNFSTTHSGIGWKHFIRYETFFVDIDKLFVSQKFLPTTSHRFFLFLVSFMRETSTPHS